MGFEEQKKSSKKFKLFYNFMKIKMPITIKWLFLNQLNFWKEHYFFSIKFLLGIFLKERNNHQKKYLLQFFV